MMLVQPRALSGSTAGATASLQGLLTGLGLTTNLKVCLDAADVSSAPSASAQKWLDLSGGGQDFFRGASGASEASDPQFNGTAGGLTASEFYSNDGSDRFTYDTTVETWMSNLHKDNAALTIVAVVRHIYSSTAHSIFNTLGGGTGPGIDFGITAGGSTTVEVSFGFGSAIVVVPGNGQLYLNVKGDAGASVLSAAAGSLTNFFWHFVAISLDESSATSLIMQVDGAQVTGGAATYASASTNAASAARLFETTNPTSQIACLAAWEGTALSAANLNSIYNALKAARAYGF